MVFQDDFFNFLNISLQISLADLFFENLIWKKSFHNHDDDAPLNTPKEFLKIFQEESSIKLTKG